MVREQGSRFRKHRCNLTPFLSFLRVRSGFGKLLFVFSKPVDTSKFSMSILVVDQPYTGFSISSHFDVFLYRYDKSANMFTTH